MADGLKICKEEFMKLKAKEQIQVIFENTEETKRFMQVYRIHQKVQYAGLCLLFVVIWWIIQTVMQYKIGG